MIIGAILKNVLSVALKYGNEGFDAKWIFQQDDANEQRGHSTQEWCRDNFPSLIDKDHCPRNCLGWNRLNEAN